MRRKYLTALRADLAGGRFGQDGRLPSFRELASLYECSVASIKLAVDTLQEEGILEPIHGKGTFLTRHGRLPLPRTERRKIIGAVLLQHGWLETMEQLKHEWQRQGWFFSIYDACRDMQDPGYEKKFLEMALQEGFSGVILIATPIEPVNTGLFAELRRQGMKIVHLAPYRDDMSHESYFMLDYSAAGPMALARAEQEGYRRIVPIRDGSRSPSMNMIAGGLSRVRKGSVEVVSTFCYRQKLVEWVREREQMEADELWRQLSAELVPLAAYSRDTVLLAYRAEIATELKRFFQEIGKPEMDRPAIWALDRQTPGNKGIEAVSYDLEAQVRDALGYICDSRIDPLCRVQKLFSPIGFKTYES